MPRPSLIQSAIGLLIAASSHAMAGGLPSFQLHAAQMSPAPGIEALLESATGSDPSGAITWEHELLLGLLELDASPPDPAAGAEVDRLHQSDQAAKALEAPLQVLRVATITYTATNLASPDRGLVFDMADLTPRSLNFERDASTRPTLAFFIPSLGTPALLTAGLLTAARRGRH